MSTATCNECGATFEAEDGVSAVQSAKAQLGRHRRREHGIVGATNRPRPPGRPRRRRVTTPRPASPPKPESEKTETPELFIPEAPPKRGFLRNWLTREEKSPKPGEIRPSRPKTKRQPGRRTSLAPGLSFFWGSVLAPAVNSTGAFPVARVLEVQAPAAGPILDRALRGTVLDKIVQPLAAEAGKWGDVGMLAAFPLAMAAYCQSQNPGTEMALRWAMRSNMVAIAAALRDRQEDEAAFAESVAELSSIGLVVPGDPDPLGTLIASFMVVPVESVSPNGAGPQPHEVPA